MKGVPYLGCREKEETQKKNKEDKGSTMTHRKQTTGSYISSYNFWLYLSKVSKFSLKRSLVISQSNKLYK